MEDPFKIKEEKVRVKGKKLHCKWLLPSTPANSSLPVLILLHEGLGSIAQWKDFPETLVKKLQLPVLAYDRYGYGKSDPLEEKRNKRYLHREALEFLPELMEQLQLNEVIFFGHSDGGTISLIYASEHPGKVKAVITEAAHVYVEQKSSDSIAEARELYQNKPRFREALEKYHGEKTDSIFYGWANTRLHPDFKDWNIESYLPDIKCPLLALQGKDDEYGTRDQVDTIVSNVQNGRGYFIPDCKHAPHHQQREAVVNATVKFIEKLL